MKNPNCFLSSEPQPTRVSNGAGLLFHNSVNCIKMWTRQGVKLKKSIWTLPSLTLTLNVLHNDKLSYCGCFWGRWCN